MSTNELKMNTKRNLLDTLHCMASKAAQMKYKEAVPFVHVPLELLAQWDQYSRHLFEERKWFLDIFSSEELACIRRFDKQVNILFPEDQHELPDVKEIFDDPN